MRTNLDACYSLEGLRTVRSSYRVVEFFFFSTNAPLTLPPKIWKQPSSGKILVRFCIGCYRKVKASVSKW
jgi:hypothetical protein